MFEKVSRLLTIPLNQHVEVDDDLYTALVLIHKYILEIFYNKNNSTYVDFDGGSGNGINDEVPVPLTSQMQKMIISMRSYIDAHLNREMNKTINDREEFVDNILMEKTLQKKIFDFLTKTIIFYLLFTLMDATYKYFNRKSK